MSPGPSNSVRIEEIRPEMAEGTSPVLHFPISPGCFHPTGAKRQEFADIVRERVDSLLIDEQHYSERRNRRLPPFDTREWKQVQTSKELRFFKRVRGGRTLDQLSSEETHPDIRQAVENGYSTMLCDGQVRGSMEDMMYGMTASSQEDLMTGFSYKNAPKDCVWLGTAEGPTSDDPFRSADFIWAFPKLPAYSVDICYLKATGVEKDRDGKRYGYLVLHSVDLPQCRPFEARGVTRAKMYFACLFREVTPGYLNVTVRGIFNLGKRPGKIAKKLVAAATKSFMIGFLNGEGIGLAKKLTIMARRNRDPLRIHKQSECSICFKTKRKLLFGLNTHLFQCGVCGVTACSNCIANTKQILFLGLDAPRSKRPCCLTCMQDARVTWGVLPGEPEFQFISDFYLRRRTRSVLSPSSPVSGGFRSPLPEIYPLDTMTRNRSSRRRSAFKSSLSADLRTISTADESLDTDPFSRELDEADFCFSDEESNSSIVAQPDPSPVMSSDSDKSTLTLWTGAHRLHTDDFIPASRKSPPRSEFEVMQTLFQLNVKAENTYIQTQVTARGLRGAELD
ncbi:hypothetical protein PPTG_12678 [Phytophthora nicotianae INRA-310]|uniref:FYVE-type domain-containing protein n=1 Tax=Phytophthora nicotianae (strain INRA-310) TaxID=761204 RepID=W2Q124_PHYN3|nr:hypothetical protein PPTG_12678 [Phytophthora nicotianae INRA-310]ETN06601.1 hypothetical protein PPTG_12678 [Phytophthora nicotianae INRA-310]